MRNHDGSPTYAVNIYFVIYRYFSIFAIYD